jgi:hypothetical protein
MASLLRLSRRQGVGGGWPSWADGYRERESGSVVGIMRERERESWW